MMRDKLPAMRAGTGFVNGRARWIRCLLVMAVVAGGAFVTRELWLPRIAETLVCERDDGPSDAVLVDLVSFHHELFRRVAQISKAAGGSSTVLIPVLRTDGDEAGYVVALGFVEVMCRVAGVAHCQTFPVPLVEPFSLTLARTSALELDKRGVRRVALVTGGLRSRRAAAVYGSVLRRHGIDVACQPVFVHRTTRNWFRSTHGIQETFLQSVKLLYYAVAVLPRV